MLHPLAVLARESRPLIGGGGGGGGRSPVVAGTSACYSCQPLRTTRKTRTCTGHSSVAEAGAAAASCGDGESGGESGDCCHGASGGLSCCGERNPAVEC